MDQRVNFAKCFGGLYAPEAYTSLSERALSKLRAAHRYLCMKTIGWNGVETVEADDSTVRSISIGSEDSNEEYYDTRSRWLYGLVMCKPEPFKHRQIACDNGPITVEGVCLRSAPTIQYQIRKAEQRILGTIDELGIHLSFDKIYRSANVLKMTKPVVIS